MSTSLSLSAAEFDAYLPERAGSNAYSRPRIEVKQRVLAWARGVAVRLAELGISVEVHATDEHPSLRNRKRVDAQSAYFWRDELAREELERLLDQERPISAALEDPSPATRHAFLALRIDARSMEVCFAVHPDATVDVDNLRARLRGPDASGGEAPVLAAELTAALRALPEQFQIGVGPEDRVSCGAVTIGAITEMLERAASGQLPLWIGWTVGRETALAHADILGEQLEDALVALAPIYRLVAWSPENDHVAIERRLAGAREVRARTHAERTAESERWQAERAATLHASRVTAKAREADSPRPGATRPAEREGFHSSPSYASIEKGSRVRVCAGPFANKLGVVAELDGRGAARVLLGLLSTRVDLVDLEPVVEGRDRPALQSSHRRPAAPVPRKAR